MKQYKQIQCEYYSRDNQGILIRCTNEATHFFLCGLNSLNYRFPLNKAICNNCYDKAPDHNLNIFGKEMSFNKEVSRTEFLNISKDRL